jgi:gluconokinase
MVVIVMGVSGAGKSTIGRKLASDLGWQFVEGDDWHPASNIDKLRRGIPLTDEDRLPWLLALQGKIQDWIRTGTDVILASSALRQCYRDMLVIDPRKIRLVYLKASFLQLTERLRQRGKHFMAPELLQSQFETLEEPPEGLIPPAAIVADAAESPETIVAKVREALGR